MSGLIAQIQVLLRNSRVTDLLLPLVISASVLIIFVPLPTVIIDVLLSINIAMAVIILLTTLFVSKPLDFSIFPTILLATTLFRLVLSIATTRLILTQAGESGMDAAGQVIRSFSEFVAGDNVVVGFIIFSIIVVIQFVVITKGATRVAEVAARFTLDAMPGRQMAIDQELGAGLIDEKEAKRRREEVAQASDFFGAMDGASKFVRGDAIASIVIIFVNILGGLYIGMVENGMTILQALALFTSLTIGDGLVSQVPALLISLATGLLVTRSSHSANLPQQFISQMLAKPIVLVLTAAFLVLLTTTSLPSGPLWTIAVCALGLAYLMNKKAKDTQRTEETRQAEAQAAQAKPEEQTEDYLKVDAMSVELGVGLIPLADPNRGGDLLDRIHLLRKEVAEELGIILPRVRIQDSFNLDQIQYRIKIAGQPVAQGIVYPDLYLAIDPGTVTEKVQGLETLDPAFGTPALWIDEATKDQAEIFGYTVVEPGAVITTHLLEIIRRHADELLSRQATQELLNKLRETSPAAVDELIPNVLKLGQVQQVLQLLLREQVPIKQLGTIIEFLGDYGAKTKDPILLTTYVRTKLARTISTKYRDSNGMLHFVMIAPDIEDQVRAGFVLSEQDGFYIRMPQSAIDKLCRAILKELDKLHQLGMPPIVLVNPQIRPVLKQMTSAMIPNLIVLSYTEVTHDTTTACVGVVSAV